MSISDGAPLAVGVALSTVLINSFTKGTIENSTGLGHWSLAYRNYLTDRFAIGADLSLQKIAYSFSYKNGTESTQDINYFTIMPALDYIYYKNSSGMLTFYGTAMAGLGLSTLKTTNTTNDEVKEDDGRYPSFAFQINPLGLKVGNKVAGFAELGAGVKGFVTLGISASF